MAFMKTIKFSYSKRFSTNNINENDEFVRVYSEGKFLGVGRLLKDNKTISLKSDKIFV